MDYYERELGSRGFTTERLQQLFSGVGLIEFTKDGGPNGRISADGNQGFILIAFTDES